MTPGGGGGGGGGWFLGRLLTIDFPSSVELHMHIDY